jgi:hypothetical protein
VLFNTETPKFGQNGMFGPNLSLAAYEMKTKMPFCDKNEFRGDGSRSGEPNLSLISTKNGQHFPN